MKLSYKKEWYLLVLYLFLEFTFIMFTEESLRIEHESDFTLNFHFHALEKGMATHSSVLAWRIPGKGEPGGLPSMGLHRVRYD